MSGALQAVLLLAVVGAGVYLLASRSGGGLLPSQSTRDNRTPAEKFFGAVETGARAGSAVKSSIAGLFGSGHAGHA